MRRAALGEILALRHAVLRPGLPRQTAEFDGDDEPETLHVGAFRSDGAVVGCASAMRRSLDGRPGHQLRGMATRGDLAGRGIGARVLAFVEAAILETSGPGLAWCNARVEAVEFYRRRGWVVVSEVFDVPTVGPHRRMTRELTPPGPPP